MRLVLIVVVVTLLNSCDSKDYHKSEEIVAKLLSTPHEHSDTFSCIPKQINLVILKDSVIWNHYPGTIYAHQHDIYYYYGSGRLQLAALRVSNIEAEAHIDPITLEERLMINWELDSLASFYFDINKDKISESDFISQITECDFPEGKKRYFTD